MKSNRLTCSFLCLLLIFGLQGCGQKKGANSPEKTSGVATNGDITKPLELYTAKKANDNATTHIVVTNETTIALLKAKSEQGDASSSFMLAGLYENGFGGVSQDAAEALKWYRKAAEQGNVRAQYHLGYCYFKGQGVTQDYVEAFRWYREAAEQGDADAQSDLGLCYDRGRGVESSETEAVKW